MPARPNIFLVIEIHKLLLDVTYQSAFAASKKPSSAPQTAAYVSPLREKYWDVQAKLLTELMDGIDKDKIREAVSQLKYDDEAYHEHMIPS